MSKPREGHSVLKVAFPSAQLPVLKATAAAHGTTMSDFGREAILRALGASTAASAIPQGPHVYADAVEAAARASSGIPRVQLECIVAAVVNSLHKSAIAA